MENQTEESPSCAKRIVLMISLAALALSVIGALTIAYRIFAESGLMK